MKMNMRFLPTEKARLLALMVLIALLNLGPHDDCCRNAEDEEPDPELVRYCVSATPNEVVLKPGETSSDIAIGDRGCDPIDKALPWRVSFYGAVKSATIANPASPSTTMKITALEDPTVIDRRNFSIFGGKVYGAVFVSLSNAGHFSDVTSGTVDVDVDISSLIDPFTRKDQEFGEPAIAVNPRVFGFGNVKVGPASPGLARIIVGNLGRKDLIGSMSTVQTEGNFTPVNVSIALKPNYTYAIPLGFSPQSAGFKTASIIIRSNDPNFPTVTVTLYGTGVP